MRERSIPVPYMRRPRRRTYWPRALKSRRLHGRFLTKSGQTTAVHVGARGAKAGQVSQLGLEEAIGQVLLLAPSAETSAIPNEPGLLMSDKLG